MLFCWAVWFHNNSPILTPHYFLPVFQWLLIRWIWQCKHLMTIVWPGQLQRVDLVAVALASLHLAVHGHSSVQVLRWLKNPEARSGGRLRVMLKDFCILGRGGDNRVTTMIRFGISSKNLVFIAWVATLCVLIVPEEKVGGLVEGYLTICARTVVSIALSTFWPKVTRKSLNVPMGGGLQV